MATLPFPLLARLDTESAAALRDVVGIVGVELAAVHRINLRDHRESRGDNAQIYGLKNYVHCRFRLEGLLQGNPRIHLIHENGAYRIVVPPISIGAYCLGSNLEDDIHECFPVESPSKRTFGTRNRDQIALFENESTSPLTAETRYGLNDLIVGHFGNPRDGLVKWYLGAYVFGEDGSPRWAWVERQELPTETIEPLPAPSLVTPFSAAAVEPLSVQPRQVESAE
jgi:hypothetical protein